MTKVKGLSVIQCREYIRARHGEHGVEQVRAAMEPEAREVVCADTLLPTDWIELAHALEHSRAFDGTFGKGDGQLVHEMIREVTTRHMTGLYKSLIVGFSVDEMLERSSRLWNRYYDRGESQIEKLAENRLIKRILGCPDLPRHHDWLTSPYYEALLRYAGAKEISVKHIKCVANGANCCETELRWRPARTESRPLGGPG